MTINCTNNRLSVLSSVLSVVGCYALRPKILSMPYSCRAYTLLRQPCPARLGEMNTTAWLLKIVIPPWKRKILRWRFFSPSAGLDLVRADWLPLYLCTIRNGIRGFACAFAYNTFGLTPSSDRRLANDCSWWAALLCLWVRYKDGRIVRLRQMCPSNRTCRMWLE